MLDDCPGIELRRGIAFFLDKTRKRGDFMSVGTAESEGLIHCEKLLGEINRMTVTLLAQNEGTYLASMAKVCGMLAESLDIGGVSLWRREPDGPTGGMPRMSRCFCWTRELGASIEPINKALPPEGGIPLVFENANWGYMLCEGGASARAFAKAEADVLRSAGYLLAASMRRHERGERIRQADKGVQIMLDEMPVSCLLMDAEHNLIDCNGPVLELFGARAKRDFIKRFWDYSPQRQPDGTLSAIKKVEIHRKTYEEGSCTFEWMHRTADGVPLPTEIRAVKLRYENRDIMACYIKDLSNRRRLMRELQEEADKSRELEQAFFEAEKMTLAVTEASPIAYVQYDKDRNPLDCNAEALRLFGAPNKRLFLENHWNRLMPEFQPDGQSSAERSKRLSEISELGGRTSFEWYYMTFGGETFPTETSLTKIEYRGNTYIIAFIYDLRRTKKMEQSIIQLESEVSKIYYDPLTGLYNRRFLDENLRRVIKRYSDSGGTLSMMMVDIDHFKPYNDTYGHIAGDKCLKAIAETLRNTAARDGDFVARYGGEEFVVVLPHTDEEGVRNVAERMLENVRQLALPHESSDVAGHVTVSIGAVTSKVKYAHSVNAYVHRADEIMYKSKRGGRDQDMFEYMD
jgi:diguanylate cyclase (GGDEF)-like protein/PAS domain S-box-containing protein